MNPVFHAFLEIRLISSGKCGVCCYFPYVETMVSTKPAETEQEHNEIKLKENWLFFQLLQCDQLVKINRSSKYSYKRAHLWAKDARSTVSHQFLLLADYLWVKWTSLCGVTGSPAWHQPTTPLSYQTLQVCCGTIALTVLRCDLLPDLGLTFRHLVAGEVETFSHTAAILKP